MSRVGKEKDVVMTRLPNAITCPIGRIAMMTVMRAGLGAVQSPIAELISQDRASDIYLLHDENNPCKPLTPNKIKRQLVQALAKINVKVEPYEVQSLLHATHKNCMEKMYNFKVSALCMHVIHILLRARNSSRLLCLHMKQHLLMSPIVKLWVSLSQQNVRAG